MKSSSIIINCIVTKETIDNEDHLVAYVHMKTLTDKMKLREELFAKCKSQLPAYMIPTKWIFTLEFPLNINGKIDRKRLNELKEEGELLHSNNNEIQILSPLELKLQDIIMRAFRLSSLPSIRTSFNLLGGTSIGAMRALHLIRQEITDRMDTGVLFANPSVETFEQLYRNYSTQVQCPCRRIIINYGSFLSLTPRYHPVCSSDYLSDEWMHSLTGIPFPDFSQIFDYEYKYDDFHHMGASFFSTVKTLCSMAQTTYSNSYLLFEHSALVTDYAMSSTELQIRMNDTLDQFQSNRIKDFKQLFSLIRFHTQSMLTSVRTNADLYTNQLFDESQAVRDEYFSLCQPICFFVEK